MDLEILAEHGVSTEAWEKILNRDIPRDPKGLKEGSQEAKLARLCNRIRSRVQEGQNYNFSNYQILHAMDKLWDTPFQQATQTMVDGLMSDDNPPQSEAAVLSVLRSQGMDMASVVKSATDPKSGKSISSVSYPDLVRVTVPLVRSYLTVRKAKIVNDRNRDPLLHYKPVITSPKNRAKTQVMTNRAQLMNTQYNYVTALDQAVFQMLLYPTGGTMFTYEDWHVETQMRYKTTTAEEAISSEPKKKAKRTKKQKKDKFDPDDYEEYIVREGLRMHLPHPSRTYIDKAYSPRSMNTDTGCRYAGFWKVVPYGDILDAKDFYNTDKVSRTSNNWWQDNTAFFNSIYNTCVLNWDLAMGSNPPKDREKAELDKFYGADERDRSVVLVEHREKLIPKDDGLGDYEHPIWARFVLAGDGTIVFAQPLGYVPVTVWKDNGDDKRTEDASLALNLAGFQDHFSNLLSQHIYSVRQNLANLTLIDENIFTNREKGKTFMDRLKNLGSRLWTGQNIMEFDSKKLFRTQTAMQQAFYSHRFPALDTNGIVQSMKLILDLAERVLQFSNQEVAQQATHEQTRAEIVGIQGSTTNVLEYTGMPVDQAMAAMGKQIYDAWNAYGEDDFATSLQQDPMLTKKDLEEMGFTLQEEILGDNDPIPVRANKNAIEMPLFAVIPATRDRVSNADAARVMAEFVRDLTNNPMAAQALGPKQTIDLANQIAKLAGLPLDRELRDLTVQQGQEILQQVIEQVLPMVKEGMVPVLEQVHETDQKVDALYQALGLEGNENGNSQNGSNVQGATGSSPGMAAPVRGGLVPQAPALAGGPVSNGMQ